MRRGQAVFEWNPPPQFTWPLEVGKWGSEGARLAWSVEAYEPIRVPAGTFQAFRIEVIVGTISSMKLRLWYAPEARQYVKAEFAGNNQAAQLLHTFQLLALDRPAPLQIALQGPADQARVTSDRLPLQGTVTGGRGVARVVITLNGQEVARQDAPPGAAPREMPLTATLPLQAGTNVLRVTATDPAGTSQEVRTVHYEKPAAAAVALRPAPAAGRWWWAWAATSTRRSPGSATPSPTPRRSPGSSTGAAGFKPEHVLLLTDTTERKPTYRNLKWALGTFLARSAQKDDTVLIFFAGHGAPEVDQRGLERDGLAKYLIPSDADPEDLYATALPMDELQTIFARLEAERVVVFLDTCYSGAAGGRTFASLRTRAGSVDDLFLERLARTKGRAIITASRPNEVSLEVGEYGHGLFTYYLLQGLGGAARSQPRRDRLPPGALRVRRARGHPAPPAPSAATSTPSSRGSWRGCSRW